MIQIVLNVKKQFGISYLKIVKSPTGPHYIIDMMFKHGLRLTSNFMPGDKVLDSKIELEEKVMIHRATEYNQIQPTIEFIMNVLLLALSDEKGRILESRLQEDILQKAWEISLFREF